MSRRMRAYYYAVLGAMGGLIGWQISNLLGLSFSNLIYLSDLVVGALIGLSLGVMIGIVEGLLTRNPIHAMRAGSFGGALGFVAGAVGLPLGEFAFQVSGAGAAARAAGWGLFGLLIGLAEGVTGRSQAWKGALGGLAGGLVGGGLLEITRGWLGEPQIGKVAGLILLGMSVGAFIALVVVLLSRAWLEVVSGKLKGTEFILDKFMRSNGPTAILGSDALKADIVLPDPDVAPQHAMLQGQGTHFTLQDMSTEGTFINNRKVSLTRIPPRAKIRVGNTELVYHERR
ncbi:MAG TPA: FHA domain-containing protein [Anaerolineales bacterium]|nr:FHA domain-containing protein [Anaerolineales bacterium]